MKEYVVLKIKCRNSLKIADILTFIKEKVTFNENYFAIQNLKYQTLDTQKTDTFNKIGLNEFSYRVVLPHLAKTSYYAPEKHDRLMISNLDNRWEWCNESNHVSLSEAAFGNLVHFCDGLNKSDISTLIIGIDEIEWNGKKVEKGTYGYQQADCTYRFGDNYLSNSITIGRDYSSKTYTVCLSCEKQFSTLRVITEIVDFLGEIKETCNLFAPETNDERIEWEIISEKAKIKLQNALLRLNDLPLLEIDKECFIDRTDKINIKKYITKYLCTDGWELKTPLPDEHPIIVCKNKDDTIIKLSVISNHNGHHLQVLLWYRCAKFNYCESIHQLFFNEISEFNIEKYFINAVKIRDFLYEIL